MGHADEGIVLTDSERQALARLAESIGDPWLAGQLAGQDPASQALASQELSSQSRRPAQTSLLRLSGWAGGLLVAAGAALVLATFTVSTALATVGLMMMGAGLWHLVPDGGPDVAGRVTRGRARPRPEPPASPQPPPPRTPPAAG